MLHRRFLLQTLIRENPDLTLKWPDEMVVGEPRAELIRRAKVRFVLGWERRPGGGGWAGYALRTTWDVC